MALVREHITTEEDLRLKEDSQGQSNNNKTTTHRVDIQKKTFNLFHADGLIPVGNTFSVTQQKLNSSAAQTELTLSASRTAKEKED